MAPDRIVVGASSDKARKVMKELYAPLAKSAGNVIFMDARSAEMTKYAANAFLATKISFINEIANLCEAVGANVDHVREGIGSDQRIGRQFLYPGIGYGGSCFPKDVRALNKTALDNDYEFSIIGSVMHVNAMQKKRILQKIEEHYEGDLKGKTFALWGLAFKPNTDDIREAPAIEIIEYLLARGARIKAFDPEATENIQKRFSAENSLQLKDDQYEALSDSNALIIATEWNEFRSPDFDRMKKLLKQPVIFDGRNLYAVEDMEQKGFMYESIGRRKIGKKV
jgi:UDPglucose 6-dehydrogenase